MINEELYSKDPTSKKLNNLLRKVWDYDEYVYGLMDVCQPEEDMQKLIEVLERGVNNKSEISLWAVSIREGYDINQLKAQFIT